MENKVLIQFKAGRNHDEALQVLDRVRDLVLNKEEGDQATLLLGFTGHVYVQIWVVPTRLPEVSVDLEEEGFLD